MGPIDLISDDFSDAALFKLFDLLRQQLGGLFTDKGWLRVLSLDFMLD